MTGLCMLQDGIRNESTRLYRGLGEKIPKSTLTRNIEELRLGQGAQDRTIAFENKNISS